MANNSAIIVIGDNMTKVTSFSDKLLLKAASSYVYTMSDYIKYEDPIKLVKEQIKADFLDVYTIAAYQNKRFKRDASEINLRYLLINKTGTNEYALIFQGSKGPLATMFTGQDHDWAYNLSSAAHLKLDNYAKALAEFKYLKNDLNYNITALSGNSLGGGYALHIASHNDNVRAIGLNPAPPEFNQKYINNGYSTIVLQSSDILYRLLKTDSKRSNYGIENQLTDIFGFKPYIIERSIPYNNSLNMQASHIGDFADRYSIIEMVYQRNSLYYNSKIIGSNQGLNFSKYLFVQLYRNLPQVEYFDFIEDKIYNNMFISNQRFIESFSAYPALANFATYDLLSNQLLDTKIVVNSIKKEDLGINLEASLKDYGESIEFLTSNSLSAILDSFMNDNFTYKRPKFLAQKLKLDFEWDWEVFKIFLDFPLSIKLKAGELYEKFARDLSESNKQLTKLDKLALEHESKLEYDYAKSLYAALKILDQQAKSIVNNIKLLNKVIRTEDNQSEDFTISKYSLEHLPYLDEGLLRKSIVRSKTYINNNPEMTKTLIRDFAALIEDGLTEAKTGIETKTIKDEAINRDVVQAQVESLFKEFDFEEVLSNFILEFENEITHLLMEDNNGILVYYNLIQMRERNLQLRLILKNLSEYLKLLLSDSKVKYLESKLDLVAEQIDYFDNLINSIIND